LALEDSAGIGKASHGEQGPIAHLIRETKFDRLLLLANDQPRLDKYVDWLSSWSDINIDSRYMELANPTDHRAIYHCAIGAVDAFLADNPEAEMTFDLTPGTPQMSQIWLLLARTHYSARLVQTTKEHGVVEPDVPFTISAEFLPRLYEAADSYLQTAIAEIPPEGASFGDILYQSSEMAEVIRLAKRAASRRFPIVIQGESGTGKELLAKAIHNHGPRAEEPFKSINCGAIPKELVESYLFGSVKGAYSNAIDRKGFFEAANDGTLFLDEIGDLPLDAQVTLLRALQEGTITRVGDTEERSVNVRIIAATNRDLIEAVAEGDFREDLLYRLVGMIFNLPALRERKGDIGFLADHLMEQINDEGEREETGYMRKTLSAAARNVIIKHTWPGNVRELRSTIRRAAIWTDSQKINASDIVQQLLPVISKRQSQDHVLGRPLGEEFEIEAVLTEVARHYLARALNETGKNKSQAAKLLGLGSYQTVSNWIKKYELNN